MRSEDLNIANRIKSYIHLQNPAAKVILFGSRARGDSNNQSDWDILVVIDKPLLNRAEEKEYRNRIFGIELKIEQPISLFVVSKTDWDGKYILGIL